MVEARFSGQTQYGLNLIWWMASQNASANTSTIRAQCWLKKYSGTGYYGYDGWYMRMDSPLGGVNDLLNLSGSDWSFQNGANTGEWWYYDGSFVIPHAADGKGSYFVNAAGKFGTDVGTAAVASGTISLARIPKRPSPPGSPQFTNVLPTSVTVSWSASSDNAGSAITGYILRWWPNAEGTGPYQESTENNTSRTVTGLNPGTTYRFVVMAKNSSVDNGGVSNPSAAENIRLISGGRVRTAGTYKIAIPYVRQAGEYRLAIPFVRSAGVYKNTQ